MAGVRVTCRRFRPEREPRREVASSPGREGAGGPGGGGLGGAEGARRGRTEPGAEWSARGTAVGQQLELGRRLAVARVRQSLPSSLDLFSLSSSVH